MINIKQNTEMKVQTTKCSSFSDCKLKFREMFEKFLPVSQVDNRKQTENVDNLFSCNIYKKLTQNKRCIWATYAAIMILFLAGAFLAGWWTGVTFGEKQIFCGANVTNFGERCPSGRDDECKSNAKCISGVCGCDVGRFWNAGQECDLIESFGEYCPSGQDNECKNNAKCVNGVCGCDVGRIWNTAGEQCDLIESFGEHCPSGQDNECKNNAKCVNGVCGCDTGRFWNTAGEQCDLIESFGERCPSGQDDECKNNAKCVNGVCGCDTGWFWNTAGEQCDLIESFGERCPSGQDNECKNNAKCVNGVCGCDAGRCWNGAGKQCDWNACNGGATVNKYTMIATSVLILLSRFMLNILVLNY